MGLMDKVKQASNDALQQAQGFVNEGITELKGGNPPTIAAPAQEQPATQEIQFCPQCGNNIAGQRFCSSCGYCVAVSAPAPSEAPQQQIDSLDPIYTFVSHIQGKNARVKIFPQYIEWEREGSKVAHTTAAVATLGVSLLAGKKHATEMVPIKSITHVAMKKDGLTNTKVILSTSGGNIEMRVSHAEAQKVKDIITNLLLA